MAYRKTFCKIRKNFVTDAQIEYDIIEYGLTMDLQKMSFIFLDFISDMGITDHRNNDQ